ncbi:hypothetical protein V492_02884 [Pseudogymnoascus sp. VKM F-4246]|nr:hypothetical protein V492_02884 [Pseudogymnoascus sp. VKM F-4246]
MAWLKAPLLGLIPLLALSGVVNAYPSTLGALRDREVNAEQLQESYDYVVVGGGQSGLVIANRLSEDPSKSVLVVEYGYFDNDPAQLDPSSAANYRPINMFNASSVPQPGLGGRVSGVFAASVVGGGSTVNGMMFDRGAADDYDNWEKLGNPGWGFSDLLPYFKKSTNFTAPPADLAKEYGITWDAKKAYGTNGPIQATFPDWLYPTIKLQWKAWAELGVPIQKEAAAGDAYGAFWVPTNNDQTYRRSYARSGYYDPVASRENLKIITGYRANEVVFSAKKHAESVTIQERGTENGAPTISVKAKQEIVLCAGWMHTPQVLQRSGLGPKDLLDAAGIKQIVDLPGVGANLQDHAVTSIGYNYATDLTPNPNSLRTNETFAAWAAEQWLNRKGPLSVGVGNSLSVPSLPQMSPNYKSIIAKAKAQNAATLLPSTYTSANVKGFVAQRDLLLKTFGKKNNGVVEITFSGGSTSSLSNEKPLSRGTVRLNTTDHYAEPIVDFNTLINPTDTDIMVESLKFARKWFATDAMKQLTPSETSPGANITSDADLSAYVVKSMGSTTAHSSGTAAMAPRHLAGVVSPELLVYGVTGLSIGDISLIPMIPSTHTCATMYAVAEKAADLIKKRSLKRSYQVLSPPYMQSEPTDISNTITHTIHERHTQSSQHGFSDPDLAALAASSHSEQPQPAGGDPEFVALQPVNGAEGGLVGELPRLNGVLEGDNLHPSSNAAAGGEIDLGPESPKNRRSGPGFKVTKSRTNSNDGIQLEQFPNEVLTHILSHLPAASLSTVSLVSRRFYNLVTTPHAWRIAFSRFFPGQDATDDGYAARSNRRGSDQEARDRQRAEQRFFARLTALASWRSEYILRTRLLRSLARGKPQQIAKGHGASSRTNSAANNANAAVTYNSQLFTTVNHIHAVFDKGRKSPRFIHGSDETGTACTSDPNIGKVDTWGLSDPQALPQFADLFPGDQPYGLGDGSVIGAPNVMDVSQPFGMVYGEGFPGGQAYFRSSEEMRGRFLARTADYDVHPPEVPKVPSRFESISSVWIAKSVAIPSMTDGLVGIMTGSSCGIITTYSFGIDNLDGHRLAKGEITARWAVSPGVPIIAISVDDSYNAKRKDSERIWAVALNALGEVFYLTQSIHRAPVERNAKLDEESLATMAWETGRSVAWKLAEPTRRVAREDTYQDAEFDGSYSPRSSPHSSGLSKEQLLAENRELETFFAVRPAVFRKVCNGWDMRRKLEVDFAGDDGRGAGESAIVIQCGAPEGEPAGITRFTRMRVEQASMDHFPIPKTPPVQEKTTTVASLFGGGNLAATVKVKAAEQAISMSPVKREGASTFVEEWRSTALAWDGAQTVEFTANAVDMSTFAILWVPEDPILTMNGGSTASSIFATPEHSEGSSLHNIPGHRGRFLTVGTKTGTVYVWDMRGPQSRNASITNTLQPLRTIQTDSPQISCLALSSLYLVHGGNDGLVQAWDPLASVTEPLRTLNSRFSSRARRRLVQAEASVQGVGINLYAAGALALDPDPTALRGMVTLGTHLRYWAYSSNGADSVSSKKRRLRRSSERGHNGASDRYTNTGRGALMDYIVNEQHELKREAIAQEKEQLHLQGRFGVGLAGLSEEEALRYAELMSQEAFMQEEERRLTSASGGRDQGTPEPSQSAVSSTFGSPVPSAAGHTASSPNMKSEMELEREVEEAIRLSLLESEASSPPGSASISYDVPFVVKTKKSRRSASTSPSTSQASKTRRRKQKEAEIAMEDLDYALQLSLAEEESRAIAAEASEEFPALDGGGKGKGKAI